MVAKKSDERSESGRDAGHFGSYFVARFLGFTTKCYQISAYPVGAYQTSLMISWGLLVDLIGIGVSRLLNPHKLLI